MTDTSAGRGHGAGRYEIRVKGRLGPRWATRFDGLTLTHDGDGSTVIHGPVADQAALHGLLASVRDLGLPLLSVTQVEPDHPRPDHPTHGKERSPDGLD
jgi:hypothetical protein